jgi:hypothetical protein
MVLGTLWILNESCCCSLSNSVHTVPHCLSVSVWHSQDKDWWTGSRGGERHSTMNQSQHTELVWLLPNAVLSGWVCLSCMCERWGSPQSRASLLMFPVTALFARGWSREKSHGLRPNVWQVYTDGLRQMSTLPAHERTTAQQRQAATLMWLGLSMDWIVWTAACHHCLALGVAMYTDIVICPTVRATTRHGDVHC